MSLKSNIQFYHQYLEGSLNHKCASSIREPDDYNGEEALSIECTQLNDKPASYQKKLVAQWCEKLPTLKNVKSVSFVSKVPQQLFDSICEMQKLESLYIKWSGIESIDSISKLRNLRHFSLGSSGSLQSLDPISKCSNLAVLDLEYIKKVNTLDFLKGIPYLIYFRFTGSLNDFQPVDSLNPIKSQKHLKYLDIMGMKVADKSLKPLLALKKLEEINTGIFFR